MFVYRVSEDDTMKLGSIVLGSVERVTPHAIIVNVDVKGYNKGMISSEHLADNHGKILSSPWWSLYLEQDHTFYHLTYFVNFRACFYDEVGIKARIQVWKTFGIR